MLKRELSTPPEAETTQLYQQISKMHPIHRLPEESSPAGAAVAAPPTTPRTNLPAPASELIGRTAAVAEVRELLAVHRLVTLIGAGGIGASESTIMCQGSMKDSSFVINPASRFGR